MKITPDMFVGPVVMAVMLIGASMIRSHVRRKSSDPRTAEKVLERTIFKVSWAMIAVGFAQFGLAALPVVILIMSPNPGKAGYVVFGGMAALWALFGAWFLRTLLRTSLEFSEHQMIYCDGGRDRVLRYQDLLSVDIFSWHIVCTTVDGRSKFSIPMQFSGSSFIYARLRRICEEWANKRLEGTEGTCPPSKHSQPPSVPHP